MSEDLNTHSVVGEYGAFEGDAADRVVLPRYAASRTWSPELIGWLSDKLARGGTLIDAGAHVGLVSIPVLERSAARAIAFEPAPLNAACLRRNVARHGLDERVEVHAIALSDRRCELRFALSADNSGDHHVLRDDADLPQGYRERRVPAAALDDVLAERVLARPVILKIDTQGSEARVLAGAQRVLTQVDAVVLEYWPAGLLRVGDRASMLGALLQRFAWGEVLRQGDGANAHASYGLTTRDAALHSLSWIAQDGSDQGFFDVRLKAERDF